MIFLTNIMTLQHSDGSLGAEHLPVQLDSVNIPYNLEAQGTIPTDWFDLYSIGWTSPVPVRTDYFIDEATGIKYSVFDLPDVYTDHLEVRVTKYGGTTP